MVASSERAECIRKRVDVPAGERSFDTCHLHAGDGQGPGLVDEQHVDPGQSLDRGELPREDVAPPKTNSANGERQARHQHKTLGHHPRHPGNGALHRPFDRLVRNELTPQQ